MDSAEKNTLEKLIRQLWLQNAWGFLYSHISQIFDWTNWEVIPGGIRFDSLTLHLVYWVHWCVDEKRPTENERWENTTGVVPDATAGCQVDHCRALTAICDSAFVKPRLHWRPQRRNSLLTASSGPADNVDPTYAGNAYSNYGVVDFGSREDAGARCMLQSMAVLTIATVCEEVVWRFADEAADLSAELYLYYVVYSMLV